MDYKNKLIIHQKKLVVISASLLFFLLAFLLVFSRTPEFPNEIPSAEQLKTYNNNYSVQKDFFNRYTEFIRDNYGGIIIAEEKNNSISKPDANQALSARFRQKYDVFKKTLVFDLTNTFARQQNVAYKISSSSKNQSDGNSTRHFEIVFLKNDKSWVIVELEVLGNDVEENPSEKLHGQKAESEESELKQPSDTFVEDAKLVIVIDDLGNRMDVLKKLISLDYDITYSILPQQQFSLETAEFVFENGREVMLHLPMEPKEQSKYNPGLGALLISDDQETIVEKMEENLDTVPYAVGINNHMGSAFTQHDEGLDVVMHVLSGRMLFFLDSKTAPGRIAKSSAKDYNVPYLSRDIFLDNDLEESAISRQLAKAARIAARRGKAIAIGHPHPETFRVLAKDLPEIENRGVRVTRISDLLSQ